MRINRCLWALGAATLAVTACNQAEIGDSAAGSSTSGESDSTGSGGGAASKPPALYSPSAGASGSSMGGSTGSVVAGTTATETLSPSPSPPMIIDGASPGSAPAGGTPSPTATPPDGVKTPTAVDTRPTIPAGQLTAGTWDDNLNFSFYSAYLKDSAQSQLAGLPAIERSNRMVIVVKGADARPVAGADVSVADSQGHFWTSSTGAEGRVIYFPEWAGVTADASLTITATLANLSATTTATAGAKTVELSFAESALPGVAALDLAFVIDTTGSMMDEISYVQAELDSIVGGVATQFPNLAQRWALVVYRDRGDVYVVRSFDFTTDLSVFRSNLGAQSAGGGGDTPEAVDEGLAAATRLGWSNGATARVAFWIADAPHHVGKEANVVTALAAAVAKGIHIYPVSASGIDELGEFTMRTAAEVTGGRYLFLTDDSGIGGGHKEPRIPCYYVTTLASAMRRMIATEVTGAYVPPEASAILRTGGDPQNQQCTLSSGQSVTAW